MTLILCGHTKFIKVKFRQVGKIVFDQRLKAGSKQADVGVPFTQTYHPNLKEITQIMKL